MIKINVSKKELSKWKTFTSDTVKLFEMFSLCGFYDADENESHAQSVMNELEKHGIFYTVKRTLPVYLDCGHSTKDDCLCR